MKAADPPVLSSQVDYIWKTSIPQSWVKIKGKEHFRHAPQPSLATSTIDFLRRTQQYMSAFTQNAQSQSPTHTRRRTIERSQSDCGSPKEAPVREINLAMCGRAEFSRTDLRAESLPAVPSSWTQQVRVTPSVQQDFHHHVISRLNLPRHMSKPYVSAGPANRSVERFLHRFEEQRKQVRPRTMRRGFAAQKLSIARIVVPRVRPQQNLKGVFPLA